MLKFNITNHFSGAVQFTAEIDCAADVTTSIKIGLAVKWAIKSRADLSGAYLSGAYLSRAYLSGAYLSGAYLSGADLSGADLSRAYLSGAYLSGAYLSGAYLSGADLSGADLSGADLSRAYLSRAYLSGAYLSGADLSRADLSGADLSGADLSDQWIIQGPCRSDGYAFFLQKLMDDKEPMIKAGCRYLTIAEAQAHWERTRAGQELLDETKIIVRGMIDLARIRGLMD